MRWLLDGYNVIRRDPDLHGAEEAGLAAARAALLRRVVDAERRSGDPFTVVFDGAPGPGPASSPGRIEVVFSRPPRTADDVLMDLARRLRDGAIVVTSDRRVQDAARRAGAAAVASERFLAALEGPRDDDAGDDEDDDPRPRGGNPRRISRDERAVRRALRRLGAP
ncbi:MAG: NYN domain-containing protein [Candidatus Rokubacteria bacterium]|nr:NYN domain-containing protein [Candidatus Rokubacteria bacterium]